MTVVTFRPLADCRYDAVALGEVMLRLDPGDGRVRTARDFRVSEGGGEYNVIRGLRSAFGLRTAVVTALVDNDVGRLVESLVLAGGVDTALVRWCPFDGVGRRARNGLNFTERGFGVRGALGVSDRGHTAASQLTPDEVDWDGLFGTDGVRWFHTGGIFAGLSESAAATALAAVQAARRHGTVVSYDLNYRASLWRDAGGAERAREVNRELAPYVDVLFGTDLVPEAPDVDLDRSAEHHEGLVRRLTSEFPNLRVVANTRRTVRSASLNDWAAWAWSASTGSLCSVRRDHLNVLDRVGGGDAFASGLAFGLLSGRDLQTALEYGAAHGALVMTTPGDTSMATADEVRALAEGGRADVAR